MPINKLSAAKAERLALLLEELGEAQQVIGKILRHGYGSVNPIHPGPNNREALEKELGDVQFAVRLLCASLDLCEEDIREHAETKAARCWIYLHYQDKAKKSYERCWPSQQEADHG